MSTDKYAQYISEQQRNLRVSGTNPVELTEKKKMTKDEIAALAGDKDKIDADDFAALRAKKHLKKEEVEALDEDDAGWYAHHEIHGSKGVSKEDWKKGVRMNSKGEKVQSKKITEQEVNTAGKSNKMTSAPATVTTLKPLNKPGLPKLSGMTVAQKGVMKEEESVDEGMTRASKGKKASLVHTLAIKPGKVPYRGKGTIPKAQNINNSYEMSDEESEYIEEAVGKGQLPSILKHHEANMKHHQKLMAHHMKLADASEDIGDHESFDHHTTKAMEHEYDVMSHKRRFDHAASLGDKVKAMKQMKSASKDMASASEKLAKARENKRDY